MQQRQGEKESMKESGLREKERLRKTGLREKTVCVRETETESYSQSN